MCVRIWTRDTVPARFRHLAVLADDGEVENTVFVAHVPAAMVSDRTYQACNGISGTEGSERPPIPPTTTFALFGPAEVARRQSRAPSSQSMPSTAWPKRM